MISYSEGSERVEALLEKMTHLVVSGPIEEESAVEDRITSIGEEIETLRYHLPSDAQDLVAQVDALEILFITLMNKVRP